MAIHLEPQTAAPAPRFPRLQYDESGALIFVVEAHGTTSTGLCIGQLEPREDHPWWEPQHVVRVGEFSTILPTASLMDYNGGIILRNAKE